MRGSPAPTRSRRRSVALIVLVVAVLGLSGCGRGSAPVQVLDGKGTPYSDLLVPMVTASVKDGDVGVAVDRPVTVNAQGGVLGSVSLVDDQGAPVPGEMSPDGVSWTTTDPLAYNGQYTLTVRSLGLGGTTTQTIAFKSRAPENLTMPYLMPNDGEVVGVGQPVAIRFDENIPDRAAAEKAIKVTTDPPVAGAFYWLSNREVRWRPENFWASGTKVNVTVDTYGVDLGAGLFGQRNLAAQFTIGDRVIATADDDTKMLTIRRNGEIVTTMPISMGKDSTPTNNGVYIVGDRYRRLIMDSATYGVPSDSPKGYRLEVDWATQMSYSGIYVHSAPWSVAAQGSSNTSHGCLNVSPANAEWFYENTKRGDVVEVAGTVGSTLSGTEGLGDWNIPWSQWSAAGVQSGR
ncbi:MAG TPA: Ig-like domain-containing protein [Mycobacterium sp.]|nr:Ig-like domain-containing protein [Mycobacterium sp.]HQC76235.1 Ig-like domain-containing protein [Mycobacterium sp.]